MQTFSTYSGFSKRAYGGLHTNHGTNGTCDQQIFPASLFFEYEDAHQELLISLFRAVQVIPQFNTDAQCVKYLAATIYHRFCTLYRQTWHLPDRKETPVENPEFYMPYTFSSYVNDYSIFNLDIRQFIQNLKNEKHRQILIFFLYGQLNDREIADLLHTSRQYIYRTRKSLLQKLYHDLYKLN